MWKILLSWIINNKLKFFLLDSFLLILNASVMEFIRKGSFIDTNGIAAFFATIIFFSPIFLVTKAWIKLTQKYPFLTIQIDYKRIIALMPFLVIINAIFFSLAWVNENLIEEGKMGFYYAMPWLIIILSLFDTDRPAIEEMHDLESE